MALRYLEEPEHQHNHDRQEADHVHWQATSDDLQVSKEQAKKQDLTALGHSVIVEARSWPSAGASLEFRQVAQVEASDGNAAQKQP
jgi:hypothetical protein